MAGMSGKVSEVKMWGRGGSFARHRSVACKGRQVARRSYSRALRHEGRLACKRAALSSVEAFGAVEVEIGEDHDAHVQAFDSADRWYLSGDDFADDHGCGCALCLIDNGVIGWGSYFAGRPCDRGLTLELLGAA